MGSVSSSAADLPAEVDEAGVRRLFFANKEELEAGGVTLERALAVMGPHKAHLSSSKTHTTVSREKIIKELATVMPELAAPLVDIHGIMTAGAMKTVLPGSAVKAAKMLREKDLQRRQKIMREYTSKEGLLKIVESGAVRLVRPNFLMKWCANGAEVGAMPHRVDLEKLEAMRSDPDEEEVFLNVESLGREDRKRLQIVSLSCSRLGTSHPDPDCFHLQTADRLLRSFCFGTRETSNVKQADKYRRRGYRMGAGDGSPVGVFWDWCSIYRDNLPEAPLTPEQRESAAGAMKNLGIWYAHTATVVWMLHYLPPSMQSDAYSDGGWRSLEREAAAIATRPGDLLDIDLEFRTLVVDKAFEDEPKEFVTKKGQRGEEKVRDERTGVHKETDEHKAWREVLQVTENYFQGDYLQLTIDTMVPERRMPLTPEQFGAKVDEEQAAVGGECHDMIKPNYRRSFKALFGQAPVVSLPDFGLTDPGVRPFLESFKQECSGLRELRIPSNDLTVSIEEFGHALHGLSVLQVLDISGCGVPGNIANLAGLKTLEGLHLNDNKFVYGRIGALSMLTHLKELGLQQCFKLEGNIMELARLTCLEKLNLGFCQKVSGDISSLSQIPNLKDLALTGRGITGDIASLCVNWHLEKLDLNYTKVGGSLAALTSLQMINELRLQFTAVTGDVKNLGHMEFLQDLRLCGTKISGDVRKLNTLENLQYLDLNQCLKIKGDVRRLGGLGDLKVLLLGGTDVDGDVKDLSTLLKLQDLNVHKTKVRGGPRAVKRLLLKLHEKQIASSLPRLEVW